MTMLAKKDFEYSPGPNDSIVSIGAMSKFGDIKFTAVGGRTKLEAFALELFPLFFHNIDGGLLADPAERVPLAASAALDAAGELLQQAFHRQYPQMAAAMAAAAEPRAEPPSGNGRIVVPET